MNVFLISTIAFCSCTVAVGQHLDLSRDSIGFFMVEDTFCQNKFAHDSLYLTTEKYPSGEELPEVLIYKNYNINALALGIIPHAVEPLTLNEKRLRTAGDFKPIQLLSILGGSLQLDPILNAISGRTKKLKKIIAEERKFLNVKYLEENYTAYIFENFPIAETDFGRFLYFIADDPDCTAIIETKNKATLQFFIAEHWVKFNAERE